MELKLLLDELRDHAEESFNEKLKVISGDYVPASDQIALEVPEWRWVKDIVCVAVDMVGSTELNIVKGAEAVAKIYQAFTGGLVKVFNEFDASYIDIRGDGAFALFDGEDACNRGLCAAVTFRTFCEKDLSRFAKVSYRAAMQEDVSIACRAGVARGNVLVKRIGLRGDKNNEVWAGRPVNVAFKLSEIAGSNELVASDNFYGALKTELATKSCGCQGGTYTGVKQDLWTPVIEGVASLGIAKAWKLKSVWCPVHGEDFCEKILSAS